MPGQIQFGEEDRAMRCFVECVDGSEMDLSIQKIQGCVLVRAQEEEEVSRVKSTRSFLDALTDCCERDKGCLLWKM